MTAWRPQTLIHTRDQNVLAWAPSRQASDMSAFSGICTFIVDREMVQRGWIYGARLLAPDNTVAAQEFATFRQYEDTRIHMNWKAIRIEGEKQ